MQAFIDEPKRIPFYLKIGIWISEKVTGKRMLPARLLSWYPKAAIGSGILESLTAHGKTEPEKRLLRLVRLLASFSVSCKFCIDMNSAEYDLHGISDKEFDAIKNNFPDGYPKSLTAREKIALKYAELISSIPFNLSDQTKILVWSWYSCRCSSAKRISRRRAMCLATCGLRQ